MARKPSKVGHSTESTENADQWLTTRNKQKMTGTGVSLKRHGSCHPAKKCSGVGRSILSPLTPNLPLHSYKTRQTSLMDFFTTPYQKGLVDSSVVPNIKLVLDTRNSNIGTEHLVEFMDSSTHPSSVLPQGFTNYIPAASQKEVLKSTSDREMPLQFCVQDEGEDEKFKMTSDIQVLHTNCFVADRCLSPVEECYQERGKASVRKKRVPETLQCGTDSLHTPYFLGEFQNNTLKHSEVVSIDTKVSTEHEGQLPPSEKCEGCKPECSNLCVRNQSRVCSSGNCPLNNKDSSKSVGLCTSQEFILGSAVTSECHMIGQRCPSLDALSQTDPVQSRISISQVVEREMNSLDFSQDSDETIKVEEDVTLSVFSDDLQTPAFLRDFSSSVE